MLNDQSEWSLITTTMYGVHFNLIWVQLVDHTPGDKHPPVTGVAALMDSAQDYRIVRMAEAGSGVSPSQGPDYSHNVCCYVQWPWHMNSSQ